MNKARLSQLFYLDKEIELIKTQIDKLEPEFVSDAVQASSPEFPYTSHSVIIKGYAHGEYEARVDRLEKKLSSRMSDLIILREEINDFIEAIQDSELRLILSLRYISGLSWSEVSVSMGRAGDGSTERKKHDRFMENSLNS